MSNKKIKYLIIGAGLSGLSAAYQLKKSGETNVTLLESRNRTGGRILTKDGIDYGATWLNDGHSTLLNFLSHLEVKKYKQYNAGNSCFIYNLNTAPQIFETNPEEPPSYRIVGGTTSIIRRLTEELKDHIKLNEKVEKIREEGHLLQVTTNQQVYFAEKVIITIPPALATYLEYSPPLPNHLVEVMQNTHTWMGNAIKVGIKFKKAFWREKGMSGTILSRVGALTELYDHCNFEEGNFTLMGFVNEALREFDKTKQKQIILTYLEKYLGKEVRDHLSFELKDWSLDRDTSYLNSPSLNLRSMYGDRLFQESYMNNKLFFSGSETSKINGGYLDGAVYSGLSLAQKMLKISS